MTDEYLFLDDLLKNKNPALSPISRQRYCTNFLNIMKKINITIQEILNEPHETINKLKKEFINENTLKSKIISIIAIIKYTENLERTIYIYQSLLNDINQSKYIEYIATKVMNDLNI